MVNDEYDDIYSQHDGSGFVFTYGKRHLSKSKVIFKDDVDRINPAKRNADETPLFVECRACKELMDFKPGFHGFLDGWWVCPSCDVRVKERTIYIQLDRENNSYLESFDSDDDIPEGCEACGGPYPDCRESCNLFDD